mmetsp:Transcript_68058/g.127584  ORF Transcript_68058/g.127584 Transcript_68058/m.127584 type:complete len:242 (+) Transcript_68058:458-1183(+)
MGSTRRPKYAAFSCNPWSPCSAVSSASASRWRSLAVMPKEPFQGNPPTPAFAPSARAFMASLSSSSSSDDSGASAPSYMLATNPPPLFSPYRCCCCCRRPRDKSCFFFTGTPKAVVSPLLWPEELPPAFLNAAASLAKGNNGVPPNAPFFFSVALFNPLAATLPAAAAGLSRYGWCFLKAGAGRSHGQFAAAWPARGAARRSLEGDGDDKGGGAVFTRRLGTAAVGGGGERGKGDKGVALA